MPTDLIEDEDKYKFIDNLSVLDIINLVNQGISSYNFKSHVPSDISAVHNQFLPTSNFKSHKYLVNISEWTDQHLMKLNCDKSKYMVINFTDNFQFNSRLTINGGH